MSRKSFINGKTVFSHRWNFILPKITDIEIKKIKLINWRKKGEFLIYSPLMIAFLPTSFTLATTLLMNHQVSWQLLFIIFSSAFLIYSMNRFTDKKEDQINVPERLAFTEYYGVIFLLLGVISFAISLALALWKNIPTFLIAIMPLLIAILYSFFRVKKYLFIKNILIGLGFGCSVIIVGTYYNDLSYLYAPFYILFFLGITVNTIVFDIKDIVGDQKEGIVTIPQKFGIHWTKYICGVILFFCYLIVFNLINERPYNILLFPYITYVTVYTLFAPKKGEASWWYYGLCVDGESVPLILGSLILLLLVPHFT